MTYVNDDYLDEREIEDIEKLGRTLRHTENLNKEEAGYMGLHVMFKKLHKNAIIPTQATDGAAAFDIYALRDIELVPGVTVMVQTGLAVSLPEGHDLKILPRSGLSQKGIVVRNSPGLIDEDYRGEICVLLKYEPENVCLSIIKLHKALVNFTKNLVSSHQFNIDIAKKKLAETLKDLPFESYKIKSGDRIAQIQLHKVVPISFYEVDELNTTERGRGGFGSTGE